jgi:hypothetical protein
MHRGTVGRDRIPFDRFADAVRDIERTVIADAPAKPPEPEKPAPRRRLSGADIQRAAEERWREWQIRRQVRHSR